MLTLASGNVRFWSPGEGAGFPLFSSPFVQFFYPLNLPLALYYRVAGGYSVVDHQTFTVLGIAVFSLGLFLWLESLVPSRRSVLFAALLVGLSWKLGEILRFPNAVHTAAWIPWILYTVTAITGDPKHKKGRITLFVSCVMLLTAGYPYYTSVQAAVRSSGRGTPLRWKVKRSALCATMTRSSRHRFRSHAYRRERRSPTRA